MLACVPNMKRQGQKAVQQIIDSIGRCGQVRRTTFEMLPDDACRVNYIGQALQIHGEKWAARYPHYMAWLEQQGISREEAVRRHQEWHAAEMQNEFWTKKKPKPVSRRKARRRSRRGQ